ncbi:arginyl-tRNA synthetase [Nematocida displodere]|uniref:arginine--tRNA ligase n=1 Tax=Nematocida displodere TaxID=1805483 RepID=A0A177EC83_9MICR|nr:arginyl-tRNA synthetase [Nematocida displodere]
MDRVREALCEAIVKASKLDKETVNRLIIRSKSSKFGDFYVPFLQLPVLRKVTEEADKKAIEEALQGLVVDVGKPTVEDALVDLAESLRKKVVESLHKKVVESVLEDLAENPIPLVKKIEINRQAQILSVFIDAKEVARSLVFTILEQQEKYGSSKIGSGKKVLVEFSSPNIAKVFHAGHLRTTIIGNYVQNIYKKMGYDTVSMNYLGDWGKQFGLLGVGFQKHGDPEKMKEDPIQHLHDVYVQTNRDADIDPSVHEAAREFFRKMEEGDAKSLGLWKEFRDLSIVKYEELYHEMNIHFDVYSGESFYGDKSRAFIEEKPYATKCEDGSIIADLGALGKVVLIKSNGSSLYMTRDIAAAEDRLKTYAPYKIIYVVASQQDLHLKQLFAILGRDGVSPETFQHINFGMVKGMSTRKGQVVFLSDVISAAKEAVFEKMDESGKSDKLENKERTATILAMSAIAIQDFKAKRIKDYEFDMKKNTSFVGNTGPYIQYTICRLSSIVRNATYPIGNFEELDFAHLEDDKCYELVSALGRYPLVLEESIRGHEASVIVTYIFQICQIVNSIFRVIWVTNQPAEKARPRLAMYDAARIVLSDAVRILGMIPLERM